ncbi:MAG: VOC family protein [Gammaproteobacteria bacterium]|nr:VOC family protein [Gammaproteobacteria bacterium]
MSEMPGMMSHVSVGVNDYQRAVAFYDKILAVVGGRRMMEHPALAAAGYGKQFPEFWVQKPADGGPASAGNGAHFGFQAASKAQVDEFHRAALAAGATDAGAPGPRPADGKAYYGCFVRDPDGNKIEAAFRGGQ